MPATEKLKLLYAQIEEICKQFQDIRCEAAELVTHNNMQDSSLHLNDVLQATEEATSTILDAATVISGLAADNAEITEQVGRIYEACGFQDISGQRIKKVLRHIEDLEGKLIRLTDSSYEPAVVAAPKDGLMSGPQLSSQAPTQEEVDRMFKSS